MTGWYRCVYNISSSSLLLPVRRTHRRVRIILLCEKHHRRDAFRVGKVRRGGYTSDLDNIITRPAVGADAGACRYDTIYCLRLYNIRTV